MHTTAIKKRAPATSASRRVKPARLWTPGFITLHLGRSIVEDNDVPEEPRLGQITHRDAVGEAAGCRRHRDLPVHVEPDLKRGWLDHAGPGDHHDALVAHRRKVVVGEVLPIG